MRIPLICSLLLLAANVQALQPGDIAFTAFNADAENFAFTSWVDIAPNTTLHFSDRNWSSASQSFTSDEGWLSWNSGAGISAGQIIVIHNANPSTNRGSLSAHAGYFGLSASGDNLYAYLGEPSAPTLFLAALSTEAGGSSLAGLSPGTSLIQLANSTDYADYSGPRSGLSLAQTRSQLASASNWSGSTSGDGSLLTPDTSAFTLSPVPEPGSLAMLLAGLGILGGIKGKATRAARARS